MRLEVRTDGQLQQWVDYGYSPVGCLTSVTDVLGGMEEYEYDRYHRMTAAALKTGVRFEYEYEYEANTGRCKKTWGPKGLYAIELESDAARRETRVIGEESRVLAWSNEPGRAARISLDDGTVLEEYAFDEHGFEVATTNGCGEGTQRWYDARGNEIRRVDANGITTRWE